MDKTLLLKTFVVQENPGLALTDPRFNELSTHIQSGDFKEVANLAETIISEDIYDIRVICYFLYGVFLEHGAVGLQDIFQSILNVFSENWDALGPVKNKEKQVTNSIKWLLKQLTRKIDYEEKKESAEWISWQQDADTDTIEGIIDLCAELQKILSQQLGDLASQLVDGISSIKSWLGSLLRLIYIPEPEPEEEAVMDESEQAADAAAVQGAQAGVPTTSAASIPAGQGNFHLTQLHKKIAAFQSLIEKEKFEQASLVAFDIDQIIENFDPRLYFPEIFAEFSLKYSMNIKEILTSKKYVKSAEWQALKEVYKVDIDRFAAMDLDLDFSQIQVEGGMGDDAGYDDGYVD